MVKISEEINSALPDNVKQEKVDEKIIKQLSFGARGDLCPMQAVIGSITAQEVMKVRRSKKEFYFNR